MTSEQIDAVAKEIAAAVAEAEHENNSTKICLWGELVSEILSKHFVPPQPSLAAQQRLAREAASVPTPFLSHEELCEISDATVLPQELFDEPPTSPAPLTNERFKELPDSEGWWLGSNGGVIRVMIGRKGVLCYYDYEANYHGMGLEHLESGLRWTLISPAPPTQASVSMERERDKLENMLRDQDARNLNWRESTGCFCPSVAEAELTNLRKLAEAVVEMRKGLNRETVAAVDAALAAWKGGG